MSLAARVDRRRMWWLFSIVWIVLIVVGLVEGPRYDYRAYMKQWARVLAGGNPWLDDPGNVYGVGHQIMAWLFLVHPLAPKLLYILSSFGTFLVMFDAQRRDIAVGLATFALLFATPFFVILTPLYGVEDTLVTFLTLVAVDLRIRQGRIVSPALLLAAAVLTKIYPLALLPFIATDRGVISFRFVGVFGAATALGLLASVAVWGPAALGIVPFALVREGKMLSIFWFLSQSALSPIAHSPLARALIVWNSAVVAAVMALLYALHFFGKMRALPGTVVAILGLLAFYKVGNPQYFLCSASLLIYYLTVDRDRGTLADRRLLGAAGAYLLVLNLFQVWYQVSGGSIRFPEVRAFVGLPAFITGIALVWLIVSRELREPLDRGCRSLSSMVGLVYKGGPKSEPQQRRDPMAQLKINLDAQRFSKGLTWKDYMAQMGDTRARTEDYYSKAVLTDDEKKFFGGINQVKYAMMLAENWCGDVHRNSPLIAHVCEALQGCDLRVFFRDKETDLRDTFLNNGYQSIPVVVFFDKDWNEIGRWIERSHAATGKAAQIRAKTVDVAPKDQADAAMAEMRKQVGDAYTVPGAPLWRAAVAEMRLVLENRLGLAPKK